MPESPAKAAAWVAFELPSLEKARLLVTEYPHHRPHLHLDPEGTTR